MMNNKNELMQIGEIARAVGVAATTLRYYEREGVLVPASRSGAGYRLYDRRALQQLSFIRSAQAVGFTLEDIHLLLDIDRDHRRPSRKDVQALIGKRLREVEQKMKDLKRVSAALKDALHKCRQSAGACPVLTDLHAQQNNNARCGGKRDTTKEKIS